MSLRKNIYLTHTVSLTVVAAVVQVAHIFIPVNGQSITWLCIKNRGATREHEKTGTAVIIDVNEEMISEIAGNAPCAVSYQTFHVSI